MKGRFIDLHTHSAVSDGTDSPAELVRKAAELGLAAVALTDHDATDGLDEAEEAAKEHGIRLVRGCELSVYDGDDGAELHILGLWIPRETGPLEDALRDIRRHRVERNAKMVAKLASLGLPMDMDDVLHFARGVTPGRPHIASAMVAKGYVKTVREAFELYIGEKGKAFVPRTLLGPEDGIRLLAAAGATVALAHPFLYAGMTGERLDSLLPDFKSWGMTALEVYHSAHSDQGVRVSLQCAERHGLLCTGGSDYHGGTKPETHLGAGRGGMRVPLRLLETMEEKRTQQGLWV
jgi:predicted metal-dependent phosphoesterase TrpH